MTPMSSPLDGNGVAAAEAAFNASINNPQMVPCSKCEGRGFHHGFGEDGNDPDWCTECGGSQFNVVPGEETRAIEAAIAAYLASAAPSQTAVEPVAAELAMLVNWLPKLIAALGSKPEHVDDVARLARVHALIPTLTAQAAALAKAEGRVEALMAERTSLIATKREQLAAAESEAATLKARVAELEADRDQAQRNRDMWKAQCERQAAQAATNTDFLDFVVRRTWDNPLSAEEALSAIQWHPTLKAFYERSRIDPRRLTHQEKNNGR